MFKKMLVAASAASLIAIVTTLGIVLSLVVEAWRFFTRISPAGDRRGESWSRTGGSKQVNETLPERKS